MKILAISDMHGNLKKIFDAIHESKPDLILSCGDWGDNGSFNVDEFRAILNEATVFSVFGNHDDMEFLSGAVNTDGSHVLLPQGQISECNGLQVFGISGIWAKSHKKPYYVTDEDVAGFVSNVGGQHVDILMSHGCAIGIADTVGGRRGGQRCFLDAFHATTPRLYLCGHLHAPQKRMLKDGRIAINVGCTGDGDYWVIDFDGHSIDYQFHQGLDGEKT